MRALIQRVACAKVSVDHAEIACINHGLLAFIGIEALDGSLEIERLSHKLLNYRIFADELGKMNLSLSDIRGDLLLVSQFTLAADTKKGLRPSFSSAKKPSDAALLFDQLTEHLRASEHLFGKLATGQFGANMQVALINDGPVTFHLQV